MERCGVSAAGGADGTEGVSSLPEQTKTVLLKMQFAGPELHLGGSFFSLQTMPNSDS